nr:retrotransposon protein putative Ty1-copia subclass [Tanacetum cinerariifolium]
MYDVKCTWPDVAFAQNLVSRYQQNPGKLHWVAVKHILKYLRNTKDMFLVYGGNPDTELEVESGEIKLIKVHTDKNLADAFTKALPRGKVNEHANGIGLRLASSFMHICD